MIQHYSNPHFHLIKSSIFNEKVASLEGENLVVFYYLSAFQIWPDKNGDLWWELPFVGMAFGGSDLSWEYPLEGVIFHGSGL